MTHPLLRMTLVKTIAVFRDLPLAYLVKGRLEADGIFSIILDEYLIGIDWMYSQAIGGVKLQVGDDDVERARKILKEDYSATLKSKDIFEEVCPKCGSPNIALRRYSLWSLIPTLYFGAPVFFPGKKWRCADCGQFL